MLALYRAAQGKGPALWLPLVFSTLRMLEAGAVVPRNEANRWLGREPLPMLPPARSAELVSIA